jgi:hypothetical protein
MTKYFLSLIAVVLALPVSSFAGDGWIGNFSVYSSRDPQSQCGSAADPAAPMDDSKTTYGQWDRTQAAVINLCFEVYAPGVTDKQDADSSNLDIYTLVPNKFPARFIEKKGNNFVYAISLRDVDPVLHGVSSSGNTDIEAQLTFFGAQVLNNQSVAQSPVITIKFE